MSASNRLRYYGLAVAVGPATVTVLLLAVAFARARTPASPRAIESSYAGALYFGWWIALIFAWLLRVLAGWYGGGRLWRWVVTGAVLGPATIVGVLALLVATERPVWLPGPVQEYLGFGLASRLTEMLDDFALGPYPMAVPALAGAMTAVCLYYAAGAGPNPPRRKPYVTPWVP